MRFLVGLRIFFTNIALPMAVASGIGAMLYWHALLIGTLTLSLIMGIHFLCQHLEASRVKILDLLLVRLVLSFLLLAVVGLCLTHLPDGDVMVMTTLGDGGPGSGGPEGFSRLVSWIIAVLPAAPYILQTAFETVFGD